MLLHFIHPTLSYDSHLLQSFHPYKLLILSYLKLSLLGISWPLRARLVEHLKHMFLVFKQYYTYFYTLFHLQIFQKNTNNITQILLSNRPKSSNPFIFMFSFTKFTLHYVTIKPEFWKEAFSKISHFDFYVLSCKDNAFMYVLHIIELGAFWHVINFDWKISLLKCQYVAILL